LLLAQYGINSTPTCKGGQAAVNLQLRVQRQLASILQLKTALAAMDVPPSVAAKEARRLQDSGGLRRLPLDSTTHDSLKEQLGQALQSVRRLRGQTAAAAAAAAADL
jgi:hypothetical protein